MQTPKRLAPAALAAALALAGCASFDGSKPQAELHDANKLAAARTLESNAMAAQWPVDGWWKDFKDPQLDALIEEATKSSPQIAIAQARLRRADALARAAGAALKPTVNGNLSIQEQLFSENSYFPPPFAGSWTTQNQGTIDFNYEFDFWGRNRSNLRAALGEAKASKVDADAAHLMLSVAIAQAYVDLIRNYAQLDVERATLEQRQKLQDLTSQRFTAGLDSRVELKQAETALPQTRERIARLEESIGIGKNRLAALVGAGPDRALDIQRPTAQAFATGLPTKLPADLIGRRPDIVAQRLRVEAASANIDAAKAAFYPNISLVAYVGLQSLGLSKFISSGSEIAGIGPALSLPIFEGGKLRANLSVKDADYDIAVEQYNETLVEALQEVANQLASFHALEIRRRESKLALVSSQDAYDLAVLRYREGLGNYLQVLSAETQVLIQKSLAADMDARELELSVNLIRALGGGYQGAQS
ncbi:MAG TPA: efflux transporter outer membrane subunit [Usitatibacter sp.]